MKVDINKKSSYTNNMKTQVVISMNYSATTQERGEDPSQGLCL